MCPKFNFWHALSFRVIISDCMRSTMPKLPKMGICDLNMCLGKNPKVYQIWYAGKSFTIFSCRVCANFHCIFRLIACLYECLQSTECKHIKMSSWHTKLFLLKKINAQKCNKFTMLKKVSQFFLPHLRKLSRHFPFDSMLLWMPAKHKVQTQKIEFVTHKTILAEKLTSQKW